jgi:hypothetical protein
MENFNKSNPSYDYIFSFEHSYLQDYQIENLRRKAELENEQEKKG